MKVTFDGSVKTISINPGELNIDVETDLYSDWKEWVLENDNSKYPPAFRTFGGDPTLPGQTAPKYFFLINDWRVVVDGQNVNFSTNLYEDSGEPIITLNGSVVTNQTSDSPTVDTGTDLGALGFVNGRVVIDPKRGTPGIDFPKGTFVDSVDNYQDARTIALSNQLHRYHLMGSLIPNPIESLADTTWFGDGGLESRLILDGNDTTNATFINLNIRGEFNGLCDLEDCVVNTSSNFSGFINHCRMTKTLSINPTYTGQFTLNDCSSSVVGETRFELDISGSNCEINIRNWTGGLLIKNLNPNNTGTIDCNSGVIEFDPSCTGGTITVRGITNVIDNSNGAVIAIQKGVADTIGDIDQKSKLIPALL